MYQHVTLKQKHAARILTFETHLTWNSHNSIWRNKHGLNYVEGCYTINGLERCYCLFITICKLTHWGRVTHICVSELTIIGSDNGLSPGRRQAIIWTIAGISLIGPFGTNFSEIIIEIPTFSLTKMRLNVSSAKWRPFCLGFKVLNVVILTRKCTDCYAIVSEAIVII